MSRLKYKVVLGLVLGFTALASSGCMPISITCTGTVTGISCTP